MLNGNYARIPTLPCLFSLLASPLATLCPTTSFRPYSKFTALLSTSHAKEARTMPPQEEVTPLFSRSFPPSHFRNQRKVGGRR